MKYKILYLMIKNSGVMSQEYHFYLYDFAIVCLHTKTSLLRDDPRSRGI